MMIDKPNYREYTLNELYGVLRHIDRDKYPDRLKEVESEISDRLSDPHVKEELARNKELVKYKTFWSRFWAGLIDGILFSPIVLWDRWIWENAEDISLFILCVWFLFSSVCFVCYSIIMHGYLGQTIGKRFCSVKVFDILETKLSFKQAVIRDIMPLAVIILSIPFDIPKVLNRVNPYEPSTFHIATVIIGSATLLWFLVEVLTMLTNDKRRALHDYIAGSVVTRI